MDVLTPAQDYVELIQSLTFPRVSTEDGFLTKTSAQMLLIELERSGFRIISVKNEE